MVPNVLQICRETCYKMTMDVMNGNHAISDAVKTCGITEQHMAKAAEALAQFMVVASEEANCTTVEDAVGKAGLYDLPQPVLMVMFSMLGQAMLGRYWDFVRFSALPEIIAPSFSKELLLNGSELMQKVFAGKTNMDMANAMKDMKKWAAAPTHQN